MGLNQAMNYKTGYEEVSREDAGKGESARHGVVIGS